MLDGAESSFLDLRDPSHLDFEYHQQMDAVLTALRLAEEGVDVLFRIDSREKGVKNPDVEMNQQVWEFKAPTGEGKNTVDSQMKRAGKQAERLVLDLRRSELDDKKSIGDVRQGMQGRHLTQVIVIDHAGNIVHIP